MRTIPLFACFWYLASVRGFREKIISLLHCLWKVAFFSPISLYSSYDFIIKALAMICDQREMGPFCWRSRIKLWILPLPHTLSLYIYPISIMSDSLLEMSGSKQSSVRFLWLFLFTSESKPTQLTATINELNWMNLLKSIFWQV